MPCHIQIAAFHPDPLKHFAIQVIRMVGESQEPVGASVGGAQGGANKTPTLEEYGTNLTQQAEEVRESMKSACFISAGFSVRCCATHSMISCGG